MVWLCRRKRRDELARRGRGVGRGELRDGVREFAVCEWGGSFMLARTLARSWIISNGSEVPACM